ncbi:hypothetical protein Acr_03g0007320 [Actinidia rufa]|uniref:NAD(P)-binding Rossmann-fold superfamily protein n=1 Tax=Actinidia rufa TaxID=165716 RepID=A0A7J0EBW4_9ERIC|nr:hypothetical protein Acr_03g0007320 [Actinidia rufa]
MAEVEVRTAHNILEACVQTDHRKVVFTSSATAVIWRDDRNTMPDFDERNWSDVNFWLLMSPSPDKLMTIDNPYLKGVTEMYEDGLFVTVDLRFLVDAHICILEDVSSYGRYVCFNQVVNSNNAVLKLARMLFPPALSSPPPQSLEDKRVYQQRISNKKLSKLMVEFHSGLPS